MSEIKNVGTRRSRCIFVVSTAIILSLGISSLMLYLRTDSLQIEVSDLQKNNESFQTLNLNLETKVSYLTDEKDSLQKMIDDLEVDKTNLQSQINSLTEENDNLYGEVDSLKEKKAGLQNQIDDLLEEINDLEWEIWDLDWRYNSYVDSYEEIQESINLRSSHPTKEEKNMITPDDPDVQSIVLSVTGGWSDHNDWNEYWDDCKKLYDWIVDNIEYRSDGFYPILPSHPSGYMQQYEEMWQFPNETLSLEQGDCEDMAILLTSLLSCYNEGQYAVYAIVVSGHVGVFFPVANDKICILDPAMQYYTSSGYPSYRLSSDDIRDEANYWIDTYDLERVEWVFSTKLWKEFSTTLEFTDWLISKY